MEKTFKDKGIDIEEKTQVFILSGDTEPYRAQFTNLNGKELKNGNWSFTNDKKNAVRELITEEPQDGVEGVALNPEDMSTPEILDICEANDLALDTTDREECLKGADVSKPAIDPREIRLQIRKELEKELDLNKADPKLVYDVIVAYFGRDIAPDYKDYLPLYQDELLNLKGDLKLDDITLATVASYTDDDILMYCANMGLDFEEGNIESCKAALFSPGSPLGRELRQSIRTTINEGGELEVITARKVKDKLKDIYGKKAVKLLRPYLIDIIKQEVVIMRSEPPKITKPPALKGLKLPKAAKTVKEKEPKVRKARKKKLLEIDAKTQRLFDSIRQGILKDIVSFTPAGVEFIFSETIEGVSVADVKALMHQQEGEDNKMYTLRKVVTGRILNSPNLALSPDTTVLLGYLVTKKIQYAVQYDPQVEAAIDYVRDRV